MGEKRQGRSERKLRTVLPNELGLPALAGVVYLVGSPAGYHIFSAAWKSNFLTSQTLWVWWIFTGFYFLVTFAIVAKAYFVGVKHYADHQRKTGSAPLIASDAVLVTVLMTAQATVREPSVYAAVGAAGFKHLDWFLFVGAVLAFAHVTTLVVPTVEDEAKR